MRIFGYLVSKERNLKNHNFCAELKTFYPGWEIVNENKATDIKDKGEALSGPTWN